MTRRSMMVSELFLLLFAIVPALASAGEPDIAFGTKHAVALRSNGEVLTWGDNVGCQLGRTTRGNTDPNSVVVLRNARQIAAAAEHTLVLTTDGKVYGWGTNPQGQLGTGDLHDQCEGPVLIESLAGKDIVHIATGQGFSVAVSRAGDVYCTGDNSVGQCPVGKVFRVESFSRVQLPELAGSIAAVHAGTFHTLLLTEDGRLYAFGRGRDGQLGNGRMANGAGFVAELAKVVSFSAGTWHSVAVQDDGTAWAWGSNNKSQLCDGTTTNRSIAVRIALPAGVRIAQAVAGGHGTILKAEDGTLYACGDNQLHQLGLGQQPTAPQPARVPAPPAAGRVLAAAINNSAFSPDGCALHIAGYDDYGIVAAAGAPSPTAFTKRGGVSLCATAVATAAKPAADVVNPAPRGGQSSCWTSRDDDDAAARAKFAQLRKVMLTAETLLKNNAAFLAAPEPVRFRTSLTHHEGGGRMHVKVVPERKQDGTRLWTEGCEVIPQLDRIGGAIAQVSVFVNPDARGSFLSPSGDAPKRTGTVAGYPEYDGWVILTKDGRLPWIPQTLADRLDLEGARREKALAEAADSKAPDADALRAMRERQLDAYRRYRASFSAEALGAPAVWGDPTGEGRRRLDQRIAELRIKHGKQAVPLALDALAEYELTNIQPGERANAMKFKHDPTFPDYRDPNRIQAIAVKLSFGDPKNATRHSWGERTKESFDWQALAALLQ